jgi:hypothetical protein
MRSVSDSLQLAVRIAVTIGGGYACTALVVTVGAALLARAGMARSEAVVLMAMLGFPLYLGLLLWGFGARRMRTLWLLLGTAIVVRMLLRITWG